MPLIAEASWLFLVVPYTLWLLYIVVMGLHRARLGRRLGKVATVLGLPFLIIGVVLDVMVNVAVATPLLWERPRWKEWTVSARLSRHLAASEDTWRKGVAQWICEHLLDPFDPSGMHCD